MQLSGTDMTHQNISRKIYKTKTKKIQFVKKERFLVGTGTRSGTATATGTGLTSTTQETIHVVDVARREQNSWVWIR